MDIVTTGAVCDEEHNSNLILPRAYDEDEGDADCRSISLIATDEKKVTSAEDDFNDSEEEKGDVFEDDDDSPSQSPPEIAGLSNEPEIVEKRVLSISRDLKKRKTAPLKEIQDCHIPNKNLIGSRSKKHNSSGTSVCRSPSVHGLTIPFRTIKKAMKLDPDIPIVQNEAAIMTTVAVELFLKRLVVKSNQNAKNRGRNTVRYEDVAEARTADKAFSFLEPLLP